MSQFHRSCGVNWAKHEIYIRFELNSDKHQCTIGVEKLFSFGVKNVKDENTDLPLKTKNNLYRLAIQQIRYERSFKGTLRRKFRHVFTWPSRLLFGAHNG